MLRITRWLLQTPEGLEKKLNPLYVHNFVHKILFTILLAKLNFKVAS